MELQIPADVEIACQNVETGCQNDTGGARQTLKEMMEERFSTEHQRWSENFDRFKNAVIKAIPDYVQSSVDATLDDLHVKFQQELTQAKIAQDERFELKLASTTHELQELRVSHVDQSIKMEAISGSMQKMYQDRNDQMANVVDSIEKVEFISRDLHQWRREKDDQMASFADSAQKAELSAKNEVESLRSVLKNVCQVGEEVGMRFVQIQNDVFTLNKNIQLSMGVDFAVEATAHGDGALREKLANLRNEAMTLFAKEGAGYVSATRFENEFGKNGHRSCPNHLSEVMHGRITGDGAVSNSQSLSSEVDKLSQRVQGLADNIGSVTTCLVDLREDVHSRLDKSETQLSELSKLLDKMNKLQTKLNENDQAVAEIKGALSFARQVQRSASSEQEMSSLQARLTFAELQVERLATLFAKGVAKKDDSDLEGSSVTNEPIGTARKTSPYQNPAQSTRNERSPSRGSGARSLSPPRILQMAEQGSPSLSHSLGLTMNASTRGRKGRTVNGLATNSLGHVISTGHSSVRLSSHGAHPSGSLSVRPACDDTNGAPQLVAALHPECQAKIQSAAANVFKVQQMNNLHSPESKSSPHNSLPFMLTPPFKTFSEQPSSRSSSISSRRPTNSPWGISPMPASWSDNKSLLNLSPGQPPPGMTKPCLEVSRTSLPTKSQSRPSSTNSRGSSSSVNASSRRPISARRSTGNV